jgi:hypothetical protein
MPKPTRGDDPAPSTADIDADSNPQQPRCGTLSRSPRSTSVSSLDAFPSANALIYYRVDFLMAHEGSKYTNLLRQQTDPDSGELYGNDVTPPARKKSPKPVPSREQQRHNVTERAWRRILRHQPHLSKAGARVRHSMITHTNHQIDAENDRHYEEVAMRAACEEQSKESARQQRFQEQRAGLAEQAALLNSPSLRGLGLQLNPDFAAASNAEEDDDEVLLMNVDNHIRAARAELEEMDWVSIDLDSVPSVPLPRRTLTSFISRSPGRYPRTLISDGAPSPVTPISSTAGLTTVSTRTTYQSFPENPVRLARQFLTRAIKGNTMRRRAR